ncbi:MAG: hypothetical protein ACLVIY_09455 [Anaerobutyricum soehngenii]
MSDSIWSDGDQTQQRSLDYGKMDIAWRCTDVSDCRRRFMWYTVLPSFLKDAGVDCILLG